jgi:hypothetical protein
MQPQQTMVADRQEHEKVDGNKEGTVRSTPLVEALIEYSRMPVPHLADPCHGIPRQTEPAEPNADHPPGKSKRREGEDWRLRRQENETGG